MYEKIETCPVCDNANFDNFLICTDHRITKESFAIVQCQNCELLLTNPRPIKDDLSKYYDSMEYIAHTNKSIGLIDYIYKAARKYSIRKKYKLISNYFNSGRILDIGCGTGQFLECFKSMKWNIHGVEPANIAREQAEKVLDQEVSKTVDEVSGIFQAVTLWHVLEHLPDINDMMESIKTFMDKESRLFMALPNYKSYDARHYNSYWAGYDVPRHLYHFSQLPLRRLVKKHDLKLLKTLPLNLDAYYISLLSEQYKGRRNIIKFIKSFITAWNSNIYAKYSREFSSLIYIIRK